MGAKSTCRKKSKAGIPIGKKKSTKETKAKESETINENKFDASLQSAESLAKAMAANMVANQADPDWEEKRMERQSRIAAETRKEFAEKEQKKKALEEKSSQATQEKSPKEAPLTAKEIAKAMVANMSANQADPSFEDRELDRQSVIAEKVLKESTLKEANTKKMKASPSKVLEEKAKKDAKITAQGIAEAMAANMTANQADPNWESEHEQMASEVAKKVFKKGTKENPQKETPPTAKETAEAMVTNMTANQSDPDFELKREQQNAESADFSIKKNAKKLAAVGIRIPGYTENGEKMDKKDEKKKPDTDPKKK